MSSDQHYEVPELNDEFVCIAHCDKGDIAAVISSYFATTRHYFPIFLFTDIDFSKDGISDFNDDGYISRMLGDTTAILINNAIVKLGGCRNIILAGLTEQQKSYINIPSGTNIIVIDDLSQAKEKLYSWRFGRPEFLCRSSEVALGLYEANQQGAVLAIDNDAPSIISQDYKSNGLVVIEDEKGVFSIIGVNYAISIKAHVHVVEATHRYIDYKVESLFLSNHDAALNELKVEVEKRVGGIVFSNYKYATFFTNGLPYAFILKNIIPFSSVALLQRPDFFVFNAIAAEHAEQLNSAVIFSPQIFEDEETDWISEFFMKKNFYVRNILGQNATVRNFDFHARHFPYDVLHICTHGGQTEGFGVTLDFIDRDGKEHVVEYDEIVGFSPIPDSDLIEVHQKTIFRRFDGFVWMSDELRQQKLPRHVFEDMKKAMSKHESNEVRKPKGIISTSCAIVCYDSIHQGMFHSIASHGTPVIYNNTCFSAYGISHFFLSTGARAYIGTLWSIKNDDAIVAAQEFYSHVFMGTLLQAFYNAVMKIKSSNSANILVFWGLHFSTLKPAVDLHDSTERVFDELGGSFFAWEDKVRKTKSPEVKKNSIEVLRLIGHELDNNFQAEIKKMMAKIKLRRE